MAEIWNAEDKDHAERAAKAFGAEYGTKWPKAAAKITDDLEVPVEVLRLPGRALDPPAHHQPDRSTFATVRLRQRITKGPGSRAAGIAMAFKLIESAQRRWRAVNAPTKLPSSAPAPALRTACSSNAPTTRTEVTNPRHDTPIPQVLTVSIAAAVTQFAGRDVTGIPDSVDRSEICTSCSPAGPRWALPLLLPETAEVHLAPTVFPIVPAEAQEAAGEPADVSRRVNARS